MPQVFANNAVGTLSAGISSVAATITLNTGEGALFPVADAGTNPVSDTVNWFKATLDDGAGNLEIVYVRTTAGDVLSNILRGQEGTVASAYSAGATVSIRVTADDFESMRYPIAVSSTPPASPYLNQLWLQI